MAAAGLILVGALAAGLIASEVARRNQPDLPDVLEPLPPPPPPPAAEPPPAAPTETEINEGVARRRRRDATRFGLAQTILVRRTGLGSPSSVGPGRQQPSPGGLGAP